MGKRLGTMVKIKTEKLHEKKKRESCLIFSIKASTYEHLMRDVMFNTQMWPLSKTKK